MAFQFEGGHVENHILKPKEQQMPDEAEVEDQSLCRHFNSLESKQKAF